MALTVNMIGTTYYGMRILPDGTYITTKWFVFIYVPIIPVASVRVLEASPPHGGVGFYGQSMTVQRVPLDKGMVFKMYAWMVAIVAFGIIVAPWMSRLIDWLSWLACCSK